MKYLIATFLFMLSASAFADNWVFVKSGELDGSGFLTGYYDTEHVIRDDKYAMVWVKIVFSTSFTDENGTTYNTVYTRYRFDCDERTDQVYKQVQMMNGNVVSNSSEGLRPASQPGTNSIVYPVLNAICR